MNSSNELTERTGVLSKRVKKGIDRFLRSSLSRTGQGKPQRVVLQPTPGRIFRRLRSTTEDREWEDFAEEISAGLSGGNLIGFHVLEGNDGEAVDLMVESESLRYLEGYLEEVAHYDPERPTLRPMRTSLPPTWPGARAVVITDK